MEITSNLIENREKRIKKWVWIITALSDVACPCMSFSWSFSTILMVILGLLWSFLAIFRFQWSCIIFSRGHRSKFIWSCIEYKTFFGGYGIENYDRRCYTTLTDFRTWCKATKVLFETLHSSVRVLVILVLSSWKLARTITSITFLNSIIEKISKWIFSFIAWVIWNVSIIYNKKC